MHAGNLAKSVKRQWSGPVILENIILSANNGKASEVSLSFVLSCFSPSFPSCHFGKLYGVVMALSALFSLMQYPCFAMVKGLLDGDALYVSTPPVLEPRDSATRPRRSRFSCSLPFRWTSAWRCSAWLPSSIPSQFTCTAGEQPRRELLLNRTFSCAVDFLSAACEAALLMLMMLSFYLQYRSGTEVCVHSQSHLPSLGYV